MGIQAAVAAVGLLGSAYSADQQRKGANQQADATRQAAQQQAEQEQATAQQQQAAADAALQQQQAAAAKQQQEAALANANAQAATLAPTNTPKVELGTPQAITDGVKRRAAFQPQYASGITI